MTPGTDTTPQRYTLSFFKVCDVKPRHEQEVLFLDRREFYGTAELLFGDVEYVWEGNTEETYGNSILYDANNTTVPEGYELLIQVMTYRGNLQPMDGDTLWCPAEDFDAFAGENSNDEDLD